MFLNFVSPVPGEWLRIKFGQFLGAKNVPKWHIFPCRSETRSTSHSTSHEARIVQLSDPNKRSIFLIQQNISKKYRFKVKVFSPANGLYFKTQKTDN